MINTVVVGVFIMPVVCTLCYNLRSHEYMDDDVITDGLIPFIKDFLLLMINPKTTAYDYREYVQSGLAEVGYTHYPLTLLVDQLHAQVHNQLLQCLPCDITRVREITYLGMGVNDRIMIKVTYE